MSIKNEEYLIKSQVYKIQFYSLGFDREIWTWSFWQLSFFFFSLSKGKEPEKNSDHMEKQLY